MDRNLAVARVAATPVHLRIADASLLDSTDGPTRTFSPEPSVRDGGAETAVLSVSEPAPAVPPDAHLDPEEIDADDVAEVLEGRLDLVIETDPKVRAAMPPARLDRTMAAPATTLPGNTQVGTPRSITPPGGTQVGAAPIASAPTSGTVAARTVLRTPAPGGTAVTHRPSPIAVADAAGTQIVATVLVAPVVAAPVVAAPVVAAPVVAAPVVAAPVVAAPVVAAPAQIELGVPSPIATERSDLQALPVTAARVIVAGRYLEGGTDVSERTHGVGTSFLLARTPTSPFADDPYVDAQHGAMSFRPDGVAFEDFDSTNGVFVRVKNRIALRSGDMFRAGEELLRFTALRTTRGAGRAPTLGSPDPGYWGRIDVMITTEENAASYPVDDLEVTIGQNDGHLQFPDDEFLGDVHCAVVKEERGATLVDHGSPCGTWLRLRTGDVVPYGSEVLVGQTRIRIERE
jgi:hypothetical protein